jgi:hypothetical protein
MLKRSAYEPILKASGLFSSQTNLIQRKKPFLFLRRFDMKQKLNVAITLSIVFSVMFTVIAFADSYVAADKLGEFSNGPTIDLGELCLNVPADPVDLLFAAQRSGDYPSQTVWESGAELFVTNINQSTGTPASLFSQLVDSQIILPANWESLPTGTLSEDTGKVRVIVTPNSFGAGNRSLTFFGRGPNSLNGEELNRMATVTLTWIVEPCDFIPPTAAPEQTPPANANGWNNTEVTVNWNWADNVGGSGIDPDNCTFPTLATEEGAYVLEANCFDFEGNEGTASYLVQIDKTAPFISAALDRSPAATGWFNFATGAPTVSFTCFDALSGLDGACPAGFTFGQGQNLAYNQTIFDKAGNSASASVINIFVDTVAPGISASLSPARPASGWWNIASGAPTASFNCTDATSGVASCPDDYTFPQGENLSHTGTAVDHAGNSASATVSDIDVDLTAPSLTWNGGPAADGSYFFGSVPDAPTCEAFDALSGPDGCTISGYSASVGEHTLTATAYDKAGNSYSETRTYTVTAWQLEGFDRPVVMGGVWNTVRGGSTVPLKFNIFVGETELTDTSYIESIKAQKVSCEANIGEESAVTAVTTGGTSLRYDFTSGQFVFNWQTPRKAGDCYEVTMTTQDGSSLVAFFKLR